MQKHKEMKEILRGVLSKHQKLVLRVENYQHQTAQMEEQAKYDIRLHRHLRC